MANKQSPNPRHCRSFLRPLSSSLWCPDPLGGALVRCYFRSSHGLSPSLPLPVHKPLSMPLDVAEPPSLVTTPRNISCQYRPASIMSSHGPLVKSRNFPTLCCSLCMWTTHLGESWRRVCVLARGLLCHLALHCLSGPQTLLPLLLWLRWWSHCEE